MSNVTSRQIARMHSYSSRVFKAVYSGSRIIHSFRANERRSTNTRMHRHIAT